MMNRSIQLILVFLLFYTVVPAQEKIHWIDIESAEKACKKKPKKVIVDVYTNWCGWCKRMDATTFEHPEIVKYINENFYAVKLNAESLEEIKFRGQTYVNPNPELRRPTHQLAGIAAKDGRLSYPTIVYIDEELNLLTQVQGFVDARGLEPIIHFFAENAYKELSWEDYSSDFKGRVE